MSKPGLPLSVQMRHDSHYVEEISTVTRSIGRRISIDQIEPNPEQPRVEIGDLSELSASIREKGVLEPLLVRRDHSGRKWMIIAGERRWRASRLAGLSEVPCIEMDLDEQGVAEIALIENLQRKDLTVWEEADGLKALADKFGYKHDEIAQKISKSRSTVTELMTIAGLPDDIRQRCRERNIAAKATLLDIARQFDEAAMTARLDEILQNPNGKSAAKKETRKVRDIDSTECRSEENSGARSFQYVSVSGNFRLHINFKNGSENSRGNVLKALKEAFDDVKNNEVQN